MIREKVDAFHCVLTASGLWFKSWLWQTGGLSSLEPALAPKQLGKTPATHDPPQDQAGIEDTFVHGCVMGNVR